MANVKILQFRALKRAANLDEDVEPIGMEQQRKAGHTFIVQ